MKSVQVKGYKYKSGLGEKVFDEVTLSVPDSWSEKGDIEKCDYSISETEILRMERELAVAFFRDHYRSILLGQRTITAVELKAIQDVQGVNRTELGRLLGLHKGSVTNLFKGKAMSLTLANLIMERLGMELGRPGSSRILLSGGQMPSEDEAVAKAINKVRYASDEEVA